MGQQLSTVSMTDWDMTARRRRSSVAYGLRRFSSIIRKERKATAVDTDDLKRFRPGSLQELTLKTKFTEAELKQLYRGFKENCTTGCVNLKQFTEIFERYFGYGDVTAYSRLVFGSFDTNDDNVINFEEFAVGLSTLLRGSVEEKLLWIFRLYDQGDKGYIDRTDTRHVLTAVYALLNRHRDDEEKDFDATEEITTHVEHLFDRLDANNDGKISEEEFVNLNAIDTAITDSFKSLAFYWPSSRGDRITGV